MVKNFDEKNVLERYNDLGLNYINKQNYYLKFSIFFPFFSLIVNIITLIVFVSTFFSRDHVFIPSIFFFFSSFSLFVIFTIISSKQALFLRKWKVLSNYYKEMIGNTQNIKNYTTLTDIFYKIIDHMRKIKIYFILLNLIVIFYFFFSPEFIFGEHFLPPPPVDRNNWTQINIFYKIIQYLNFISIIAIILYLIYTWYHFFHWNKKLSKIKKYEREIYKEVKENL